MFRKWRVATAIAFGAWVALSIVPAAAEDDSNMNTSKPDGIDYAMYFLSEAKDADQCSMSVVEDMLMVSPEISNPAMTCPDMSAWKLFAEVIQDRFWRNWASDDQVWPSEPYGMCEAGESDADCCAPGAENPGYDSDTPATHCPYYPGDHLAEGESLTRTGRALSKAHSTNMTEAIGNSAHPSRADIDPGRVARQEMAEIVQRNKPMFDYIFENNLYNTQGLADAFEANARNIDQNAPYRVGDGKLAKIDLPVHSIMLKSNWLLEEQARELGFEQDGEHPYITMTIDKKDEDRFGEKIQPGTYWLVAMHVSSKDTPNWVWATFEHVDNPGRCDYTGCNDSYGYASADNLPEDAADNFTAPHQTSDDLATPQQVFERGKPYDSGPINPELERIFVNLDIATEPGGDEPKIADRAWRSYRLKGSQVEFTDSMGRETYLGNSVTEGGFMNSASCISCHARAGTDGVADSKPPQMPLGVFENRLNVTGYQQSNSGVPNPAWYHSSAQPPELQVLQTDFSWGFMHAAPLSE
ncbi:hypothetical protein [Fodinicurvata fenggangensis]|uniref:hypothetical protein n=1 Tax=Fodinicurvata fenggangensis TaxID=1121830 RepID=UPI0012DF0EED|nr:hypothetical protein [Fodinicurvata fenggangensis]